MSGPIPSAVFLHLIRAADGDCFSISVHLCMRLRFVELLFLRFAIVPDANGRACSPSDGRVRFPRTFPDSLADC